jgi:radical SAM protein with 4Fe4S-binding SPASM domain
MACAQIPDLPLDQFGREVVDKWLKNRVPLSGSMELDLRCNLQCHHCYRDGEWDPNVLKTEEVIGIVDQIAQAGTVWMLFTGGEIFLRRDFFEIYEHAVKRGLLVTLFTNGTMITEKIADRLAAMPPYSIEVTLYGYSRETYEKVTGIPGSRDKCYRGVELLMDRRLPLKLKTVVIKTNKHEFMDMFNFAESRGVSFKWDTQINPNFDRSLTPCKVRLSPEEAVHFDFAVPKRAEEYRRYYETRQNYRTSKVFPCGAGSRTFHIDPYGKMKMCLLLRDPEFSLREMTFAEIWNEMFPPVYTRLRPVDHQCNSCNLVSLCGKCAAWSLLEKGAVEARVEYSCEVGHRRAQSLGYYAGPVDQYQRTVSEAGNGILLPVLNRGGGYCK